MSVASSLRALRITPNSPRESRSMPPSKAPRSRRAPFASPRTRPPSRPNSVTVWLVSLKSQCLMQIPWSCETAIAQPAGRATGATSMRLRPFIFAR